MRRFATPVPHGHSTVCSLDVPLRQRLPRAWLSGVAIAFLLAPALAEEPPDAEIGAAPPPAESQPATDVAEEDDIFSRDRLTGDWGGARSFLEEKGFTFDLSMTNVFQHNVHGGLETDRSHRVSGSYDLELTFDFGAMGLVPGGSMYVLAGGSWDEGVSGRGYVGDYFGVSYDAYEDRVIDVYELWYEQALFEDLLRIRLGKIDLSGTFDTNAYANDETAQFLNTALVNTGNVPILFPLNGHGVQVVITPCEWFYFAAGVIDAEANAIETGFRTAYHGADDFVSVYEFGLTPTWETGWGKLPGGYRFGLWYDPQPKEKFFNDLGGRLVTAPLKRDDVGFYVNLDQAVWRENPDQPDDEQGIGVFARYGYAHADVNEIEHFWSVGGQYRGLIPSRDNDVLAFGAAQGILSDQLRYTGADPQEETVLELYYSLELFPWLVLTPDMQWILNPGGDNGRDAFVYGLRLQMAF